MFCTIITRDASIAARKLTLLLPSASRNNDFPGNRQFNSGYTSVELFDGSRQLSCVSSLFLLRILCKV